MTIDHFKQAFQDEARELLAELESALLELDQRRDNMDVVGRAFRALHTIKGSGAMFGFTDIAGFVHHLENAFDRLRNGTLVATADLINLSLTAGDQIKSMLDEAAGRGNVDQSRTAGILAELHQLTGSPHSALDAAATPSAVQSEPVHQAPSKWQIRFRPNPNIFSSGTNVLGLLAELNDLGSLELTADLSAIPPLDEIDAETCYLAWEMVLTTTAPLNSIRDIFVFVEDRCELTIEPLPGKLAEDAKPEPVAAAKPGVDERPASSARVDSSIRVSSSKLDQLVNLVGELVTVQARLSEVASRHEDSGILEISEDVDRLTAALRDNSMSIRMVPLRTAFERFHRVVRDLSRELHKEVELTIEGADTELDKNVIDQLNDPLVHLIRNSLDHGIETPEVRRAAGKPAAATIHISARHSGANVLIQIKDDGRGLDVEAVRARAIKQGLIDPSARLSESEIFALIMVPGFSTARQITSISGRGVGMDVVRQNIQALRGSIEMASKAGEGLTVTLRLPLTLAIIDGLLVRVGPTHFVLPLANSLECVELTSQDIQNSQGKQIAHVRQELIPYIRLSEHFAMDTPRPDTEQIMIVETEHGRFGLVVDQVLGEHQTVIKNLGTLYRNLQVISGATILGNGTVALIIDPQPLVQRALQTAASRDKRSDGRIALQPNILDKNQESTPTENFVLQGMREC